MRAKNSYFVCCFVRPLFVYTFQLQRRLHSLLSQEIKLVTINWITVSSYYFFAKKKRLLLRNPRKVRRDKRRVEQYDRRKWRKIMIESTPNVCGKKENTPFVSYIRNYTRGVSTSWSFLQWLTPFICWKFLSRNSHVSFSHEHDWSAQSNRCNWTMNIIIRSIKPRQNVPSS